MSLINMVFKQILKQKAFPFGLNEDIVKLISQKNRNQFYVRFSIKIL